SEEPGWAGGTLSAGSSRTARPLRSLATLGMTPVLDIEVLHFQRVVLDEHPSRLDLIAHEDREELLGADGVFDRHLQQAPRLGVHGRIPELLGVHFTEALVALDGEALFGHAVDLVEEGVDVREGHRLLAMLD